MSINIIFSKYWQLLESKLFAEPEMTLGTTTELHKRLIYKIYAICFSDFFLYQTCNDTGRHKIYRKSFLKAFIAKSIFLLQTKVSLTEKLGRAQANLNVFL